MSCAAFVKELCLPLCVRHQFLDFVVSLLFNYAHRVLAKGLGAQRQMSFWRRLLICHDC